MKHPPLDGLWELKQEADRERAFWNEHYQDFVQKYPDQFVAVHDGQVIAVSDDLEPFIRAIKDKGYAPGKVWSKYIYGSSPRWRL